VHRWLILGLDDHDLLESLTVTAHKGWAPAVHLLTERMQVHAKNRQGIEAESETVDADDEKTPLGKKVLKCRKYYRIREVAYDCNLAI